MLVKNSKYRAFLRGELMETIQKEQFVQTLDQIKHRQLQQARILCILLWMTAKRPNEILNITAGDISKNGNHITIKIKGSKLAYSTPTLLPLKDNLVKEVWEFSRNKFPEQYLFWAFRSKSVKKGASKKVRKKQSDGTYAFEKKHYDKVYPNLANKLWYWFNQWFEVPAYYLRHNRMTLAAPKLDTYHLMLLKGARSADSVRAYTHLNEKTGKRIAAELIK